MKLNYLQALKRIPEARGAWLMHGQEPLLEQNLLDAFRHHWEKNEVERQRYDISSASDWKTVFQALNSLSLFSTQLAIEVHGNIKPDAQGLKLLTQYLSQNSENLLLVVLPKQDSSSLKTNFFKAIDANGVTIALTAQSIKERQSILQVEADKLGIQLNPEAWHWLEQHHEHNLLAAKNTLMRVADTFIDQPMIGVPELHACSQDQSRYSSFDLNDALLQGNLAQCIKILQYLLASGEPLTLILWGISKEMRLLFQLFEQPHNALQLGIWNTRVSAYQQALKRFSPQELLTWPDLLLRIDSAIKGLGHENPHDLLQQALAKLCGQPLFISNG